MSTRQHQVHRAVPSSRERHDVHRRPGRNDSCSRAGAAAPGSSSRARGAVRPARSSVSTVALSGVTGSRAGQRAEQEVVPRHVAAPFEDPRRGPAPAADCRRPGGLAGGRPLLLVALRALDQLLQPRGGDPVSIASSSSAASSIARVWFDECGRSSSSADEAERTRHRAPLDRRLAHERLEGRVTPSLRPTSCSVIRRAGALSPRSRRRWIVAICSANGIDAARHLVRLALGPRARGCATGDGWSGQQHEPVDGLAVQRREARGLLPRMAGVAAEWPRRDSLHVDPPLESRPSGVVPDQRDQRQQQHRRPTITAITIQSQKYHGPVSNDGSRSAGALTTDMPSDHERPSTSAMTQPTSMRAVEPRRRRSSSPGAGTSTWLISPESYRTAARRSGARQRAGRGAARRTSAPASRPSRRTAPGCARGRSLGVRLVERRVRPRDVAPTPPQVATRPRRAAGRRSGRRLLGGGGRHRRESDPAAAAGAAGAAPPARHPPAARRPARRRAAGRARSASISAFSDAQLGLRLGAAGRGIRHPVFELLAWISERERVPVDALRELLGAPLPAAESRGRPAARARPTPGRRSGVLPSTGAKPESLRSALPSSAPNTSSRRRAHSRGVVRTCAIPADACAWARAARSASRDPLAPRRAASDRARRRSRRAAARRSSAPSSVCRARVSRREVREVSQRHDQYGMRTSFSPENEKKRPSWRQMPIADLARVVVDPRLAEAERAVVERHRARDHVVDVAVDEARRDEGGAVAAGGSCWGRRAATPGLAAASSTRAAVRRPSDSVSTALTKTREIHTLWWPDSSRWNSSKLPVLTPFHSPATLARWVSVKPTNRSFSRTKASPDHGLERSSGDATTTTPYSPPAQSTRCCSWNSVGAQISVAWRSSVGWSSDGRRRIRHAASTCAHTRARGR